MNSINIGILGCADIAKRYVLPNLKASKEFKVIGVASRTKQKAEAFAKEFKTSAFEDYNSLIREKSLHAIYIPLPNSLHYEWIIKSLNEGLHVLVEKSMACELKQVIEINNIAKSKNLVLLENFQFRFHSQMNALKQILNEGLIGDIRGVYSKFGFPPFKDKNNIRYLKELGGGALLDAGAYPIKLSQIILGFDIKVKASNMVFDRDLGVDLWGSAYLSDNNNVTSQISFGFDNHYQNTLEIWGSKGKLIADRIFTAPPDHTPLIHLETSLNGKIIKTLNPDNHFENMLKYFANGIKNPESVFEEYENNINQARLIEEVRSKAKDLI